MTEHDDIKWRQSVSDKLETLIRLNHDAAVWRREHDDMHRGVAGAPGLNDKVRALEDRFTRQDNFVRFVVGVIGTVIATAMIGLGAWLIHLFASNPNP